MSEYQTADGNLERIKTFQSQGADALQQLKGLMGQDGLDTNKVAQWFTDTERPAVELSVQVEDRETNLRSDYEEELKRIEKGVYADALKALGAGLFHTTVNKERLKALQGQMSAAKKAAKTSPQEGLDLLQVVERMAVSASVNASGSQSIVGLKPATKQWKKNTQSAIGEVRQLVKSLKSLIDKAEGDKASLTEAIQNIADGFDDLFHASDFDEFASRAGNEKLDRRAQRANREKALVLVRRLQAVLKSDPLIQQVLIAHPFEPEIHLAPLQTALKNLEYNFQTNL